MERVPTGIGKIVMEKPPGVTPCRDGKYSTLPQVPGVCSYHKGSMLTDRRKKQPAPGVAPMPQQSAPAPKSPGVAPLPETILPMPETLPENYWKIDTNGKAELHFEYATYKGLPYEQQKEIKAGFLWSRARSAWVSKGAWNTYGAQNIIKKLGLPLVGKEQRLTFEESIEQSQQYAERRAERRERKANILESRAQQMMKERERYRGDISFWTQPVRMSSAAGRAFANYRERVINNYFKGLEHLSEADRQRQLAQDAAQAAQKSEFKDPAYVMNRIKEADKSFKALFNWVPNYMEKAARSGDEQLIIQAEAYQDQMDRAAQKLAFFMQIWDDMSAQGRIYDAQRLKGATYVKSRGRWHQIIRLNPTTVTHTWFVGTWKRPYSEITDAVYEGESYDVEPTHVKGNYVVTRKPPAQGIGLGKIVTEKPPGKTPCKDGQFSTLPQAPGVCSYHGGSLLTVRRRPAPAPGIAPMPQQSAPAPIPISTQITYATAARTMKVKDIGAPIVQWVPVQAIAVRRDWFQNRATPYSERTVQNIVDAAQTGKFRWVNIDPVSLWAAPDGKLYMLSGHSRLEALERLCRAGVHADGRDFCHIPAKLEANLTLEQAKAVALQSNTLSTKETEIERAEYYSKLRAGGTSEAQIKEEAKRLEGSNWTTVYAISNLNPMGKTMNAIRALDKADATSRSNAFTIARWIGNARAAVKSLTNFHEDEIYSWLVIGKGYGTKPGQINNERDFSARLTSIINRRTEFGSLLESLNIQSNITLSPVERQYREELQQATQTVKDLQKQIDQKIAEYRARGASEAEIIQLTQGLQATLTRARIAYQNLMLKKSDISQYARQERGLFDELSGIRRRYYPTPRFQSQRCNYYL